MSVKTLHERAEQLLRDIHTMTTKQYVNDSAMLIADLFTTQSEVEDQLTAAREEIERLKADCKVMANELLSVQKGKFIIEDYNYPEFETNLDRWRCTCEACETARKYCDS